MTACEVESSFYEIQLPLTNNLMNFLSKPLPTDDIRQILGFKPPENVKYTLFNLYSFLKPHFSNEGRTTKVYSINEELAELTSLDKNYEYTEAVIVNAVIKYIKENDLVHPSTWFYFLPDDKLEKIGFKKKKEFKEVSCPEGVFTKYNNPYFEIFRIHHWLKGMKNVKDVKLYLISDRLADFLDMPHESEINNVTAFEHILRYIKDNQLQDKSGRGIEPDVKLSTLLE